MNNGRGGWVWFVLVLGFGFLGGMFNFMRIGTEIYAWYEKVVEIVVLIVYEFFLEL